MSHVKVSFDIPEYVGNVDGLGTLTYFRRRFVYWGLEKKTRIYQASTSELYGGNARE
jgi:GDPmannose 4,6-dehydratase